MEGKDHIVSKIYLSSHAHSDDITLSRRNFNPETRTIRKRDPINAEDEQTVEKAVEGMAERILAEDEKRRVQELVNNIFGLKCRIIYSLSTFFTGPS